MRVELERFYKTCSCGREHAIQVQNIYIESNAVHYLNDVLNAYKKPVIICDNNTKQAAYEPMEQYFKQYDVIEITDGDIHANNNYVDLVEELFLPDTDILIAVGAGTIHDLTRYVAYQHNIPFISVPTAASVDGFVSTVAAMTWHGMKKTLTAAAPICVLADTNIFSKAPYRLTASGISDLLGKHTALLDWKVSHLVTGEYFCQEVYDLEKEAVYQVEQVLEQIKEGSKSGMEKLMYALILSGLAMQMVGNSRPASGAEHHVSHLWEMEIINPWVDALHGEKVSVGLVLCLEYYEQIRQTIENGWYHIKDNRMLETKLLMRTFGMKGMYDSIIEENTPNPLEQIDLEGLEQKLPIIADEIKKLPSMQQIKERLLKAGCVTTMEELNLPADLKGLTLQLCPYVRGRLTLLRLSKLFS